jgi:hypothetical protein
MEKESLSMMSNGRSAQRLRRPGVAGMRHHPLFPQASDAPARDRELAWIHITRRRDDGTIERHPRKFLAGELQSWQDVYDICGGGDYRLVATDSVPHFAAFYPPRQCEFHTLTGPQRPFCRDGQGPRRPRRQPRAIPTAAEVGSAAPAPVHAGLSTQDVARIVREAMNAQVPKSEPAPPPLTAQDVARLIGETLDARAPKPEAPPSAQDVARMVTEAVKAAIPVPPPQVVTPLDMARLTADAVKAVLAAPPPLPVVAPHDIAKVIADAVKAAMPPTPPAPARSPMVDMVAALAPIVTAIINAIVNRPVAPAPDMMGPMLRIMEMASNERIAMIAAGKDRPDSQTEMLRLMISLRERPVTAADVVALATAVRGDEGRASPVDLINLVRAANADRHPNVRLKEVAETIRLVREIRSDPAVGARSEMSELKKLFGELTKVDSAKSEDPWAPSPQTALIMPEMVATAANPSPAVVQRAESFGATMVVPGAVPAVARAAVAAPIVAPVASAPAQRPPPLASPLQPAPQAALLPVTAVEAPPAPPVARPLAPQEPTRAGEGQLDSVFKIALAGDPEQAADPAGDIGPPPSAPAARPLSPLVQSPNAQGAPQHALDTEVPLAEATSRVVVSPPPAGTTTAPSDVAEIRRLIDTFVAGHQKARERDVQSAHETSRVVVPSAPVVVPPPPAWTTTAPSDLAEITRLIDTFVAGHQRAREREVQPAEETPPVVVPPAPVVVPAPPAGTGTAPSDLAEVMRLIDTIAASHEMARESQVRRAAETPGLVVPPPSATTGSALSEISPITRLIGTISACAAPPKFTDSHSGSKLAA